MNDFETVAQDLRQAFSITKDGDEDKFKVDDPENGQRVRWYYKEDEAYAKEWGEGRTPRDMAPYSGILVLGPDKDTGCYHDFDSWVVVIDAYPTEKCSPDSEWVALARILANESLVEVFAAT